MRHPKLLAVLFLFVIFSAAAWAEEKQVTAQIAPDGVQRVEMIAGSYFFDPNRLVVKVNVPVEIKITKQAGLVPHDIIFKAPEAGIDVSEELGTDPRVIKFTPTKTGEYPFYCDKGLPFVKSHRERGMEGVLIVTP